MSALLILLGLTAAAAVTAPTPMFAWTSPGGRFVDAELVSSRPGIWTKEQFLSDSEVAGVLAMLPASDTYCAPGSALTTCWGKCRGNHSNQVGKECNQLRYTAPRDTPLHDHEALANTVIQRMFDVWGEQSPALNSPTNHMKSLVAVDVMRYQPGAGPTHAHLDVIDGFDNIDTSEYSVSCLSTLMYGTWHVFLTGATAVHRLPHLWHF